MSTKTSAHAIKLYCLLDGPYLVTFCCLLPCTTQIHEVQFFVHPQMYTKKLGLILLSFGADLKFYYYLSNFTDNGHEKPT